MTKNNSSGGNSCLPAGLPDVSITVNRFSYGPQAVLGIGHIENNHTGETASFLTMENARAGDARDKPPIPTDIRGAFIRDAHGKKGARIQLEGTPGYQAIQIHPGNHPYNAEGCTMVGDKIASMDVAGKDGHTHPEPLLQGSQKTMHEIMAVAHSSKHPVISVETRNMFDSHDSCVVSPSQPLQTPIPSRATKQPTPSR